MDVAEDVASSAAIDVDNSSSHHANGDDDGGDAPVVAAAQPKQTAAAKPKQTGPALLPPGVVERVFREAAMKQLKTLNSKAQEQQQGQQQHPRQHDTVTTQDEGVVIADTSAAKKDVVVANINVSRDARIAANRGANVSLLMIATLAADAKLMEAPSSIFKAKGKNKSTGSAATGQVSSDNVLTALSKAGFGHLVQPIRENVFPAENPKQNNNVDGGLRRQRGEV